MAKMNDKKELSPKIVNSFKRAKREVAQTKVKVEIIEKEIQAQKLALERAKIALDNAEKNINQANLDMLGEFARVSGISVMEIMVAFAGKDFFSIQEKVEKNGCSKDIFNDFLALISDDIKSEEKVEPAETDTEKAVETVEKNVETTEFDNEFMPNDDEPEFETAVSSEDEDNENRFDI